MFADTPNNHGGRSNNNKMKYVMVLSGTYRRSMVISIEQGKDINIYRHICTFEQDYSDTQVNLFYFITR